MRALAERLEDGRHDGLVLRLLARAWGRTVGRSAARRMATPEGVRVVAVGGATLGGSGKTPLAIACAKELASAGARVVLVGHAYRASPKGARVVALDDGVDDVGDEALVAARALAECGAKVVVASRRSEAVRLAVLHGDVLVLDGVAQTTPARAALALLAVDGAEPWGRRVALPPIGDLRAPIASLVDACDALVPVVDGWIAAPDSDPNVLASPPSYLVRSRAPLSSPPLAHASLPHLAHLSRAGTAREVWPARAESRGAWTDAGGLLPWSVLRDARIGFVSAIARPGRVLQSLARRGVHPSVVVHACDHGPLGVRDTQRLRRACVDLWLATPKCAVHVRAPSAPLATLDYALALPAALRARLHAVPP